MCYCYSKLFNLIFNCYFFVANYQLYNIVDQVREQTLSQFERCHVATPTLIEDLSMIYDHIFAF